MSVHDDNRHERDLARLRGEYASLPREEPDRTMDETLRAAAHRHVQSRRWPAWSAAAGLAACVGLAVVLVPAVMINATRETAKQPATDLVVIAEYERAAETNAVRQKQRESAAIREDVMPPAAPQLAMEETGTLSMAHEEWLAREEAAADALAYSRPEIETPAAAPSPGTPLEQVQVTGSRVRADDAPTRESIEAIRSELAEAGEPAWRERLLALREEDHEAVALELLNDYRERFGKPDDFTLDDLEQEPASDEP